jgi:energy-coupling factor transporter ATP-binding protein EcfA2
MTKTRKKNLGNDMTNWYGIIPDSLKTKYQNPCFDDHLIKVPFRMMIVGNSGSGKTTLVLELIHRMQDTFGNIILCCQNADEPLYRFLASKLKPEELQIYEGYENIPDMKDLDKEVQHLIIFDDLVLERKQDKIEEYFIRARKIAKGVSCIYLTQSYFKTPKTIRLQCNYILLKKISSTRDLNMMMSDFSLGIDREVLHELYKGCTEHRENFLMVDIDSEMQNRFRLNFKLIIQT